MTRILDALAFSSLWVAISAALLCAAVSRALALPIRVEEIVLAFGGTLAVYNVDRLRDVARDARTAPLRTAFVQRTRAALVALAALGAAFAGVAALFAGPAVSALSLGVLALGLLHRRVKQVAFGKAFYIAAAWTAIVVGVPVLLGDPTVGVARAGAVVYLSLLANAVASSVRDAEAGPARIGLDRGLRFARVGAGLAVVIGLYPAPGTRLVFVAAATAAALVAFRPGERFGLVVLDGALGAGALAVLLLPG